MNRSNLFLLLAVVTLWTNAGCDPTKSGRATGRNQAGTKPEKGDAGDPATSPEEPPKPKLDPQVAAVVDRLKAASVAERVKSAEDAGKLGEKARPAAEDLCTLALSKDQAARAAALDALEKVHPRLFPHIRRIVTIAEDSARGEALEAIGQMGRDGRPALPVILWYFEQKTRIEAGLLALALIAPEQKAVIDILAQHLNYKAPTKNEQDRELAIRTAAISGLARVAEVESTQRARIVDLLMPLLKGPQQLQAMVALQRCGPEAAKASAKVKELRYADMDSVQQASRETSAIIDANVKAAEKLAALGEKPTAAALAKACGDKDDPSLRRMARERLRLFSPDVERLAFVLFEVPHSGGYSGDVYREFSDQLDRLPVVGRDNGAAAAALVAEFKTRRSKLDDKDLLRSVYKMLMRISPDSPDVHRAVIAVCQEHLDNWTTADDLKKFLDCWLGRELLEIGAANPEVQKFFLNGMSSLDNGREPTGSFDTIAEQVVYTSYFKYMNIMVDLLSELAKRRPETRKDIAAELVSVMQNRWYLYGNAPSQDNLEAALVNCGEEAYKLLTKIESKRVKIQELTEKVIEKTRPSK
jgi:hypothetical protein